MMFVYSPDLLEGSLHLRTCVAASVVGVDALRSGDVQNPKNPVL